MRKLSSWIVLILSHYVLVLFICLAELLYIIDREHLAPLLMIFVNLLYRGLDVLVLAPIIIYPPLIISLCDKISPSENGKRYLVFGVAMFLLQLFSFVICLIDGDYDHLRLAICLTYLSLAIRHKLNCK